MKVHRFFCFCLWLLGGVSGVYTDETETISVMEGDSVTLHTGVTEIHNEQILWTFRPQKTETRIAQILEGTISIYDSDDNKRFRDRLQIDEKTGSLTITNINKLHSGFYKAMIINGGVKHKIFNIAVYGILTDPVIIRDSSSSSSNCSLVCSSVLNVSDVTLSWYKGMSVLSNISVSDLSISLSLPLEIQCLDDSYRCVVNNPISNQTTHLDNISQLCQPCEETSQTLFLLILLLLPLLVVAVLVMLFCCHRSKYTQAKQDAETNEEEVDYTDATFIKHRPPDTEAGGRDQTVYSEVVLR